MESSRIKLDVGKKFFAQKHWNILAREAVAATSVVEFKARLDGV